ncbi:hypothetical protein CHK_2782 [Christensenella hongkongensis]|uniref:DUF5666 domain-containing protein n=2 Tax=Christensenella hongkongensis TaxID=270498 RepID=A0A0M2NFM4_9FIRM|nr:hypothetical protein CHK_2782 [Christensenella hongkongensis]
MLLLSLAACSAPAAPEASGISSESSAPAEGEASPSEGADGTNAQTVTPLYGKVKSLVGNSLTLDLAKQPEGGDASTVIPDGAVPDTGGAPADEYEASIGSSKSVTVTGGDEEGGSEGEGGEAHIGYFSEDSNGNMIQVNPEDMPKLELEYTGETKELTIPAGLKIYDSIGKEIKMSDLKEGNVLMVMQGEDGSIESIIVME